MRFICYIDFFYTIYHFPCDILQLGARSFYTPDIISMLPLYGISQYSSVVYSRQGAITGLVFVSVSAINSGRCNHTQYIAADAANLTASHGNASRLPVSPRRRADIGWTVYLADFDPQEFHDLQTVNVYTSWCLQKILRIPYTRHTTNETVRSITGCLPVSDRVKSFRLRFFGTPGSLGP